ncbi:hypothetical protein KI387_002842 [Taxus chinensis]|uniref:LOB domain-containing protein n=1 Tax=Taxus chinensis TaxID=29808 RepID=A0AA38GXM6_TAXCH|nr:hypothetical protein KI387_002842 [Taxus chinensis]
MQRKKCAENCPLAPYFPADDPEKFEIVHRVFGTSNITKMLKSLDLTCLVLKSFNQEPRRSELKEQHMDVEDAKKQDTVKSLVYEATARMKDPVYGCTSVVNQLQEKITELESQLAATQEDLCNMFSQYDKLAFDFLMGTGSQDDHHVIPSIANTEQALYEEDPSLFWSPLWEA